MFSVQVVNMAHAFSVGSLFLLYLSSLKCVSSLNINGIWPDDFVYVDTTADLSTTDVYDLGWYETSYIS